MVDFASPNLWYIWCKIYIYKHIRMDVHLQFIYKETNRTIHMIHVHVLLCFTKSKQPY